MAHFPTALPSTAQHALGSQPALRVVAPLEESFGLVEYQRNFARPVNSRLSLNSVLEQFSTPHMMKFGTDDHDFCKVIDYGFARRVSFSQNPIMFDELFSDSLNALGLKRRTRTYWTTQRPNVNNLARLANVLSQSPVSMIRVSEQGRLFCLSQHWESSPHEPLLRTRVQLQMQSDQPTKYVSMLTRSIDNIYPY